MANSRHDRAGRVAAAVRRYSGQWQIGQVDMNTAQPGQVVWLLLYDDSVLGVYPSEMTAWEEQMEVEWGSDRESHLFDIERWEVQEHAQAKIIREWTLAFNRAVGHWRYYPEARVRIWTL